MKAVNSVDRLMPSPDDPAHIVKGRERLARAAVRLFRKQSYHATSVGDVAREADISVGAVYLYIKTKSDLLVLLINEVFEEYRQRIYLISELDGTATEKLSAAIREYFLVLDKHHAKTEITYHEYNALPPDVRAYILQVEAELETAFAAIIAAGITSGEFAPGDSEHYPLDAARNTLWLGHLWALNRGGVRRRMKIDEFITTQTNFIIRALHA
jgi:AcrR family transcriptional regulator